MKRALWGEFTDGSDKKLETKSDEIILPNQKAEKLKKLKTAAIHFQNQMDNKIKEIKLKDPFVTQTIEVMNQTEMLQVLIDTYASKTGCNNYILNPRQMIPQVNFPPENDTNLINDKFVKPFWFIPPNETNFTQGISDFHPKINEEILRKAIRKSICGLLRIAGFNDASHSSLVMFTDAIDEFFKNFMTQIKDIQVNESKDKKIDLNVITIEKAYQSLTHNSIMKIHNYFNNDIIGRNRLEIDEFKNIYHEYDKLINESCNVNTMDILTTNNDTGITKITQQTTNDISSNLTNFIETNSTNSGAFKDI